MRVLNTLPDECTIIPLNRVKIIFIERLTPLFWYGIVPHYASITRAETMSYKWFSKYRLKLGKETCLRNGKLRYVHPNHHEHITHKLFGLTQQPHLPHQLNQYSYTLEKGVSMRRRWHNRLMLLTIVGVLPVLWWLNSSNAFTPNEHLFHHIDLLEPTQQQQSTRILTLPNQNSQPTQANQTAQPAHFANLDADALSSAETALDLIPATEAENSVEEGWLRMQVEKGESLSTLFERHGLGYQQVQRLLELKQHKKFLTHLRPGQTLHVMLDEENNIEQLKRKINFEQELYIYQVETGLAAEIVKREIETQVTNAHGTIEHSLFADGQKAGLSAKLIQDMANIFRWDIDFALNLRKGDRFSVIYEQHRCGEELRAGKILAAEFINRGTSFRAIRYENPHTEAAYYTPDGHSLRKSFLRTPVEFTRISSHFDLNRLHPILHTVRAHRGVDYAAPTGTPIVAVGNATVTFVGNKRGYGKTIVLQHDKTYSTLYAHLSKHAKDLNNGDRVLQGQVIGYVGQTGLATGPHLHYEFRIDGVHKDPLTVALPKAQPIPTEYRDDFLNHTAPYIAMLDDVLNIADISVHDYGIVAQTSSAVEDEQKHE